MCSVLHETWRVEDEFSLSIFHPSGGLAISFVVFFLFLFSFVRLVHPSFASWLFFLLFSLFFF